MHIRHTNCAFRSSAVNGSPGHAMRTQVATAEKIIDGGGAFARRICRELRELDIEFGGIEHTLFPAMVEREHADGLPRDHTLASLNDAFVRLTEWGRGRSGRDR